MTDSRRRSADFRYVRGRRVPPEPRPAAPRRPSLSRFLDISLRWTMVALILFLLCGSISARRAATVGNDQLAAELSRLQHERDQLRDELDRFSDPDWRAAYWKWRTMRREPGEYYIDFVEPGTP